MSLHGNLPQLLLILVLVCLLFAGRGRLDRLDRLARGSELSQLRTELSRMPVFSAETTQGQEAEFIRDRLPKRFPYWLFLALVVICGGALWWLSR
jgi:type VI protein secretion system component VasF